MPKKGGGKFEPSFSLRHGNWRHKWGESVKLYGKYLSLKSAVVFGGVGINPQITILRAGVDILVATPGRLLDHVSQGTVDLSGVEIFVLDEGRNVAENLRKKIDEYPFLTLYPVTVSIGVGELVRSEEVHECVARVDVALYKAKASGLNSVVVAL